VVVLVIPYKNSLGSGGGKLGASLVLFNVNYGATAKRAKVGEIGGQPMPQLVRGLEVDRTV
jgi:hypothetical protein